MVWSRIDQKTCLKCIYAAGLTAFVVEPQLIGDAVCTGDIEGALNSLLEHEVLCVMTTTSCFAPRVPDDVRGVAKACSTRGVPHIVNNAYGLQCGKICGNLNAACSNGRVDFIVQSTDKNFMVPVGGTVIASPSAESLAALAQVYPGRASAGPCLDLLITLLTMGVTGYTDLLRTRKCLIEKFKQGLAQVGKGVGERVLETSKNSISFALSLQGLQAPTALGGALFSRRVSGTRVVTRVSCKTLCGFTFENYGASYSEYPCAYLTAACALGISEREIDLFLRRLKKALTKQ